MAKLTKREYRNIAKRPGKRGFGMANRKPKEPNPEWKEGHRQAVRGNGPAITRFQRADGRSRSLETPMGYAGSTIDGKAEPETPPMAERPSPVPKLVVGVDLAAPGEDMTIVIPDIPDDVEANVDVIEAEEVLTDLAEQEEAAEAESVNDTLVEEELADNG